MAYTYDLGTVDSAHEHDGFGFGLPLSLSCVKSKHTYVVSRIVQVDMCGSSWSLHYPWLVYSLILFDLKNWGFSFFFAFVMLKGFTSWDHISCRWFFRPELGEQLFQHRGERDAVAEYSPLQDWWSAGCRVPSQVSNRGKPSGKPPEASEMGSRDVWPFGCSAIEWSLGTLCPSLKPETWDLFFWCHRLKLMAFQPLSVDVSFSWNPLGFSFSWNLLSCILLFWHFVWDFFFFCWICFPWNLLRRTTKLARSTPPTSTLQCTGPWDAMGMELQNIPIPIIMGESESSILIYSSYIHDHPIPIAKPC